jgi:hypothetical protein
MEMKSLRLVGVTFVLLLVALSSCEDGIEQDPTAGDCPIDDRDLAVYDRNAEIPDIVERWAPIIYQDVDQDNLGADSITRVDFDGNLRGSDNKSNWPSSSLPGVVYYSLVRGATHDFLGYYFYHAEDTTGFFGGGGHEHDLEGVVATFNRCTNELDSVLTNYHGDYLPYVSETNPPGVAGVQIRDAKTDDPEAKFTVLDRTRWITDIEYTFYDVLAVGVEANTHAVHGQWDHCKVLGGSGRGFGYPFCSSHGGDGVIYEYRDLPELPPQPAAFLQYPDWPVTGYQLKDIKTLWEWAHDAEKCGQSGVDDLFACEAGRRLPHDTFNSEDDDAGNLPWTWGPSGVIGHVCDSTPNMLLDPAAIFDAYFAYPKLHFFYLDNPYAPSAACS